MTESSLLALVGLLAVTAWVCLAVIGVLALRLSMQVRTLAAVCKRLTDAWKAASGQDIRVDPSLLGGEPEDVAPPDWEDGSMTPATWQRWKL